MNSSISMPSDIRTHLNLLSTYIHRTDLATPHLAKSASADSSDQRHSFAINMHASAILAIMALVLSASALPIEVGKTSAPITGSTIVERQLVSFDPSVDPSIDSGTIASGVGNGVANSNGFVRSHPPNSIAIHHRTNPSISRTTNQAMAQAPQT
jgi:hypothetical protein